MTTFQWHELYADGARSPEWSHSGIAVIESGAVVFAAPWGRDLVVIRDSADAELVGTPLLEMHGISAEQTGDADCVWLADPGAKPRANQGYAAELRPGRAGLFSLRTREFAEVVEPRHPAYRDRPWRPTSVIGVPDGVWVADGYGASLVHRFARDGSYRGVIESAAGQALSCPHGLVFDARTGEVVLADRGNQRLLRFDLDGVTRDTIVSELIRSPSSLAMRGDDVVLTELDGALLAIDTTGVARNLVARSPRPERVDGWPARDGWPNRSSPNGPVRPTLAEGALNSPHGVAVGPDGDIYLTEWVIGGRQLRLHETSTPRAHSQQHHI